MIQDHLFKGVALLEQEYLSNKSNRDQTNLTETLGVIASGAGFCTDEPGDPDGNAPPGCE